ncbi:MAG: hypothetical protein IJ106_11920 [Parasporobacterium sp.]|nr:hypothetical protein [Parasporobacterium sp.]
MIGIGIDTGGTCTDAVIYDTKTHQILAAGKTLTTKSNLEIGIAQVLDTLPNDLLRQAKSLSLSTTLATNACVENKGCRAKLLIIGTSPDLIARLKEVLSDYGISDMSQLIVLDAKTENIYSEPYDPDWADLQRRIPELFSDCDSVGIVQTFPNANGGRFEMTALRILQNELTIPLTIAYEISKETDFLKVCASTLLNARLIPLITEFIQAVHNVMENHHLEIPLMIVRSDGTLMSEDMARTCPVETLLCGPAASVLGGCELSREKDALVLDMGGTTTDIALVRNGDPVRATKGIMIGQYRTSIKGLDAQAISLGGDTAVRFNEHGLYLDTVRIIPVSILADTYDTVLPDLQELARRTHPHTRLIHEFYVLQKDISGKPGYTESERQICEALKDGPLITLKLVERLGADLYHLDTRRLEQEGILIKSGITPTDMMVLKGDLTLYDPAAARAVVSYTAMNLDLDAAKIPDLIYEMVIRKMYQSVGAYILQKQYPTRDHYFAPENTEPLLDAFYQQAVRDLADDPEGDASTALVRERPVSSPEQAALPAAVMRLTTPLPLVGIGAPIHVFLPAVAKLLGTRAILSEYSHVANALGAAAGRKTAYVDVPIAADYDGFSLAGYSVMHNCRKHLFEEADDAIAFAKEIALEAIRRRAVFQGFGDDPQIELSVQEKYIRKTILVEIIIHAEAKERSAY